MRTLHISAGGDNTRIKYFIDDEFGGIPKHMLPIPFGQGTLLGEVIRNGASFFNYQTVWASVTNIESFVPLLGIVPNVSFKVDDRMTGPLGPLIRYAKLTGKRSYGCAGDHFCTFKWEDMEDFHNSSSCPVTILITKSAPVTKAATFITDVNGLVIEWNRRDISDKEDRINIGAYIIDPDPEVLEILQELDHHKEDPFFEALTSKSLLAGFTPANNFGFNVNTERSYQKLLDNLS